MSFVLQGVRRPLTQFSLRGFQCQAMILLTRVFLLLKEVCLIRFSPETEEDEISYTLLYAYFSSRKRFGVVSNNLKPVKDMYLIPLSATDKVPHQLVPFDGPGNLNTTNHVFLIIYSNVCCGI